jgi:Flp pilus assembly protein TadD
LQHALQLAPADSDAKVHLGALFAVLGQVSRAISLTQEALMTDPRNPDAYYWLSQFLSVRGRPDAAKQAIRTAIGLQPQGAGNHAQLAFIETQRGDAKAALAAAQQESDGTRRKIAVALALQIGSDRAAADTALRRLIADLAGSAAYQIAEVYALRGDAGNTFKWLDRAWSNRDPGLTAMLYDPLILRYRGDPRFAAFCKKVGLPTTTDAVAMKL